MTIALLWIGGGCALSFAVAAVFGGRLKLRRNAYLAMYVPIVAAYLSWFLAAHGLNPLTELSGHLGWGLLGAAVVGYVVVRNVLAQPAYPRRRGAAFVFDVMWPGLAYGLADAALLSVLPVMAVRQAAMATVGPTGAAGTVAFAVIGLAASLLVTFCYHIGYPEFRNVRVLWTMYGNGVITLGFIVTGNPLAALLPHAAMHVAVVWHALESAGQLPPHNQHNAYDQKGA